MPDELEIRRRHLPHWELAGSTYFITFRLIDGELSFAERSIVLDHLRAGDPRFYELFAAVVMPDHAHLLAKPNAGVELSRMTKGIKGVTARLINESRSVRGALWQNESFDRIVRDRDEFVAKWNYTLENPGAWGLIERGVDYPWLYHRDAGVS